MKKVNEWKITKHEQEELKEAAAMLIAIEATLESVVRLRMKWIDHKNAVTGRIVKRLALPQDKKVWCDFITGKIWLDEEKKA